MTTASAERAMRPSDVAGGAIVGGGVDFGLRSVAVTSVQPLRSSISEEGPAAGGEEAPRPPAAGAQVIEPTTPSTR